MDGGFLVCAHACGFTLCHKEGNLTPEYFRLVGNMVKGLQGKNDHDAS
jgi:hypothetical protein